MLRQEEAYIVATCFVMSQVHVFRILHKKINIMEIFVHVPRHSFTKTQEHKLYIESTFNFCKLPVRPYTEVRDRVACAYFNRNNYLSNINGCLRASYNKKYHRKFSFVSTSSYNLLRYDPCYHDTDELLTETKRL